MKRVQMTPKEVVRLSNQEIRQARRNRKISPVDFEFDATVKLCELQGMQDTDRPTFCKKKKKKRKRKLDLASFVLCRHTFFKLTSKHMFCNLPNSVIGFKGSLTSFFVKYFERTSVGGPAWAVKNTTTGRQSPLQHKGKSDHHFYAR